MDLESVNLRKAIKPVIDSKRGPSIGFEFPRAKTCAEKRASSICRYVATD